MILPPYLLDGKRRLFDGAARISPNFTLGEVFHSNRADMDGLCNFPETPEEYQTIIERATKLVVNCLEPVREHAGSPLHISCIYRSPEVNRRVGGAGTSQHLRGEAADFWPLSGGLWQLFDWASCIPISGINFDQLIFENTWIHLSHRTDNRHQALILNTSPPPKYQPYP